MVNFDNDVMALKASKGEIDRSREYLIMQGFKVEEPRRGLPSVRELAVQLRDSNIGYMDNHFIRGATVYGDVADRVEETLDERTLGLRFDKKRRDAYNRQLELMAQVAPSVPDYSLRARPFWKPGIAESIVSIAATYTTCITYTIEHIDTEKLASIDNLLYTVGTLAIGGLVSKVLNNFLVNSGKAAVKTEVTSLVEALKETPQRIKLPQEGAQ